MKYTLVIKQGQDGYLIGQLKELPAVFTQGLTISELKENIADVLELYLEDVREKYVPQGVMLALLIVKYFQKNFAEMKNFVYLCIGLIYRSIRRCD